jgi:demethylmenaquinone methyltransferase/2-methoxy-6-polyprenyl-1,4-benzoquinol methylase
MEQYPTNEEGRQAKAAANRAMFDGIASRYDCMNRLMSLGQDRIWRRRLVDLGQVVPGMRGLDLCCGTGDVARELARRGASVVGLDASEAMLAVAGARGGEGITWVQGDALAIPFSDDSFDVATIAFGNRNVTDLATLYAEMRRVVVPGGRVLSLEINRPASPLPAALFPLYFAHVPALLARVLGVDPAAYRYLPDSVRRYPDPDAVAAIMATTGLRDIVITRLLGGIIVIHCGVVIPSGH